MTHSSQRTATRWAPDRPSWPQGRRPDLSPSSRENRYCREDLLLTIIDSSTAVIYMKDHEGRYQFINRHWAELFGISQESVVGKTDHDIFSAEVADSFRSNDLKIMADGHPVELEEFAPHEDGIHTYISIKVPTFDADGAPLAICGISTDITERKRMEEALRRGEEQFRGGFQAAAIGMGLASPEGRWLRVNPALVEILGYSEAELLASGLEALTHPDDRRSERELMRKLLSGEIGSFQTEKRFLHKSGKPLWVRLSMSLVGDQAGRPLHFVTQVEDITPRKQAEELAGSLHSELQDAYDATIVGWARALDLRDHETEGHSQRVTESTLRLARAMGISGAELVHIRRGALLHDIGKIGVPDAILLKPGPLTEEEWAVMRRHPDLAATMLEPIAFLRPALDIPRCHHEKWDGTGYPRGLAGEQIPLAARIFAIIDIRDALTNDRPYRPAWPEDRARAHLRSLSGTHLDPAVVAAFLDPSFASSSATDEAAAKMAEGGPRDARPPAPAPAARLVDPITDPNRLAALRMTGLMDTPSEVPFERPVQLAARLLRAPLALVSLVDDRRQFFKSGYGLEEHLGSRRETPLSHSFCKEVVRANAPLIVSDARVHPVVQHNLALIELGVVAYAGIPLRTLDGNVLGSFCVIDFQPRQWTEEEIGLLRDLAASVTTEIELRAEIALRRKLEEELRRNQRRMAEQLGINTELNRRLKVQRRDLDRWNEAPAEQAKEPPRPSIGVA